jgi:hypothetical protein
MIPYSRKSNVKPMASGDSHPVMYVIKDAVVNPTYSGMTRARWAVQEIFIDSSKPRLVPNALLSP